MSHTSTVFPGTVLRRSALAAALLALGACADNSPEALTAKGREAFDKGDAKAAAIELKNALQKNPDLGEARYWLGVAQLAQGELASAEKELRRALELGFDPERTLPALARVLAESGQAAALVKLDVSAATSPEAVAVVQAYLADALILTGDRDKAKAALAAALAAKPDLPLALVAQARLQAIGGDVAGAKAAADAILARDGQLFEALVLRGDLERVDGKPESVIAFYERASKARPWHLGTRLALASTLIEAGKMDQAKAEVAAIRQRAPQNPLGNYMQAWIAFRGKDLPAAREAVQLALKGAPDYVPALVLAGVVEQGLGSHAQAETHLRKALERSPGNLAARRALATVYLGMRQPARAQEVIGPALKAYPDDPGLIAIAGEIALQSNEYAKAAQHFDHAAKLKPDSALIRTGLGVSRLAAGQAEQAMADLEAASGLDSGENRADVVLVLSHLRRKEYDKALQAARALQQKQPKNPLAWNLEAAVHLGKGDRGAARKALEQALAIQPAYFPAAANLARLDMAERKPDDARKRYEKVLEADPKNAQALVALAQLKAATGGTPKEVEDLLIRARAASPGSTMPVLALGGFHLQTGNPKRAAEVAQEALAADPNNAELLRLLGTAQVRAGESEAAVATFTKLAQTLPDSAQAQLMLAEAHAAGRNEAGVRQALQKALQIDPKFLDARIAMARLDLRSGKSKEVLALAKQMQREEPSKSAGFLLEGEVHAAAKDWAQAAAAYRRAGSVARNPQIALLTAGALFQAGKGAEAEATLREWRKANPADMVVPMFVAERALRGGDYKTAVAEYSALVEKQPANPVLLNNLAWAYGQLKDPKALEYAERAYKVAPANASVADTLGTLLVEKGETQRGIDTLKRATELDPKNPEIHFHLGQALAKAGRNEDAKRALRAALDTKVKFPQEQAARDLLGKL